MHAPDLSDAYACLRWAISQLDRLHTRIETWWNESPYRLREEVNQDVGKKVIRLADVKQPSDLINVEVGIIIHALRSALDLLVVKLAERNNATRLDDVYFPVARNRQDFYGGAVEKIKRLSDADKARIESLKPYDGGDEKLYAIHRLDILRKHQRLIGVTVKPTNIVTTPESWRDGLRFLPAWNGFKNDAIVATTGIDASRYDILFTLQIAFEGTGVSDGALAEELLAQFAGRVDQILGMFA